MKHRASVRNAILAVVACIVLFIAFSVATLRKARPASAETVAGSSPPKSSPTLAANRTNTGAALHPSSISPSGPAAIAVASPPTAPPVAATNQAPPPAGQISPAALKQIAALETAKAARTPAQRKTDSQLVYAELMAKGLPVASGVPVQRVRLRKDGRGRVLVDIKADVTEPLLRQITALGGHVINSFAAYHAIRAAVPLDEIETLAARPDVRFVEPAVGALRNTIVSEGDAAHQADTARATFGVDGAGVKVGVLSDSVDYLDSSEIAGLVTVLPGQDGLGEGGTGEGTAMLEIIHDLAPGARLYFATANNGEAQFATNVLQLRFNYGCDIIVDDFGYYDESPFQDGVVAQAVDAVTASGGLYFSAAGNSGNLDSGTSGTWEGDFADGGPAGSPMNEGGRLHSFGAADYDTVTQTSSVSADTVLFWSDPLGGSSNDYDLFVLDSSGTSVVASSVNYQNGTQDPYEDVSPPAVGERLVIVLASGAGRFLHLDTQRGSLAIGTTGSTRGHSAATNDFCVAAVDVADTPYPEPFAGGSQDPVENFSSDGPRRMFFYPSGTAITPGNFSSTGGAVFAKPDLTAADGVTTDVSGFAPFYGTSAAAPHAAAIAALLKSYNPALTAAQIRAVLTGTALDIMTPGADRDSGAGITMALGALQAAFANPLRIGPQTGFTVGGPAGGPFAAVNEIFSLTNAGGASLDWALGNTSLWLNASSGGSALSPGGTVAETVSLNAAQAGALSAGVFRANVGFTNLTGGTVQQRGFTLVVQPSVARSTYANAVLALKPFAYWRLNETNPPPPLNTASNLGTLGAAANGFVLAGAATGQPGIVGDSVRFYNPNLNVPFYSSRVDVPFSTALNPNGPFTVEFWVMPAQPTTDLFAPASALDLSQNSGNSRMGWIFYQASDNTWQFRVGDFNGYSATADGGTAQAGVWQHVAGVYDGTNITLYVNGQAVAGPLAVSGFSPNTYTPLRLGATTIPNRGYDGWVEEAAFYSRALDASEIAAHYAAAFTNNAGYDAQIAAAGPMGYWPLDSTESGAAANALPVAFNSGSASALYGLYEPGSEPGMAGVPLGGFGPDNRACQFSGISGYIDIPGPGVNRAGPITVLAWIQASPPPGNTETILSGGDTSWRLELDGGGYPHFSDGLQIAGDAAGVVPLDDGQWHQLAGVFDGAGSESLYVDGQLAASVSGATVPVPGNAGDAWIGGAPDYGTARLFSGTVDEVAIFTNALSAAQIARLYSATNTPPVLSAAPGGGVLALAWSGVPGATYQLQYTTNLNQGAWLNLGNPITATNTTPGATDSIGASAERFYRVVVVAP